MSEVKLNLIDAEKILTGTIHGSEADRCVAALSAEPETIEELASALTRYSKPDETHGPFVTFRPSSDIDSRPWDAGIVIIDLAARIVAAESSYSQPGAEGSVEYHDGTSATEFSIPYRLAPDWLFVNSAEAYEWSRERRRQQRQAMPRCDTRTVLYGSPLLGFIVRSIGSCFPRPMAEGTSERTTNNFSIPSSEAEKTDHEAAQESLANEIKTIHAAWLLTPREDLGGKSPREVLLEKQDLIDFDLHTRSLQWSFLGEGPPCLSRDSFAYRFAGYGTHEWVVYYDLVRHLLWRGLKLDLTNFGHAVSTLAQIKNDWLDDGDAEYVRKAPANIIENERRRLPEAMSPQELIIDEDCECCRMMAQDAEMGFGPGFWHLDGCNMDDEFAFSHYLTIQEWEAENRRREEFHQEFEREQEERRQRIARGEPVEPYPWEVSSLEAGDDPF